MGENVTFKPILNLQLVDEIGNICFNQIMMRRGETKKFNQNDDVLDRYAVKSRLNLNVLLRRRIEEKKIDKKTNVIIFSGAAAVAAVVLLMLNL